LRAYRSDLDKFAEWNAARDVEPENAETRIRLKIYFVHIGYI
jgi:hypothetical protein